MLRTRLAQMPVLGQAPLGPHRQLEAAASSRSPLGPTSRRLGSLASYGYAEQLGTSLLLSFLSLCGPGYSGYTKALNPGTQ